MKQEKPAELPVIDWDLCVKLANNKKDIAHELLTMIIQQLPQDIETMKQAFEQSRYTDLLRDVHKLHGALCYSGLPRLKQLISAFEITLKQKMFNRDHLSGFMQEIEVEVKKLLAIGISAR